MESARSYQRPALDESQLRKARERARHVIVLMLENRSFDHMLGFLDHPTPDKYRDFAVPDTTNPYDLNDISKGEARVSDQGEHRLEFDPPHGHQSALTQMNRVGSKCLMNGFVAAYAQKLAGKEHIPIIHWWRVSILLALAAIPGAAAAHRLAQLALLGGWSSLAPWLLGSGAVVLLAALALQLQRIPGISKVSLLAGLVLTAGLVALAADGLKQWMDNHRGVISWSLVTAVLLFSVLWYARKKVRERKEIPDYRVRRMSSNVMKCMTPDKLPMLAELAREYAVCTRWHSSVPGATWPNRNFAHAGTSDESVDIEIGFYKDKTIFEALDDEEKARPQADKENRRTWRIYHHDTPQLVAFRKLWKGHNAAYWYDAKMLLEHIQRGELPMYAFVEPAHTGRKANSQHPGNNEDAGSEDFVRGDQLVASIYNALAKRPELFKQTVFVITYDEHGGLFDHWEPPKAVHPEPLASRGRARELGRRIVSWFIENKNRPFPFTQLGMRVPAVIVSPWIEDHKIDGTVYDHASIVASLRRLWAPGQDPLSRRDRFANDFLHLLVDRKQPRVPVEADVYRDPTFAVGCDVEDLLVDEAALNAPPYSVEQGDDLYDQLVKLNHLVRPKVPPEAESLVRLRAADGGEVITPVEPVPTAALFKAAGDSTRNGNPGLEDF